MFKAIAAVGTLIIGGLWFVSKKAKEKLDRHENPLQ